MCPRLVLARAASRPNADTTVRLLATKAVVILDALHVSHVFIAQSPAYQPTSYWLNRSLCRGGSRQAEPICRYPLIGWAPIVGRPTLPRSRRYSSEPSVVLACAAASSTPSPKHSHPGFPTPRALPIAPRTPNSGRRRENCKLAVRTPPMHGVLEIDPRYGLFPSA